MVRSGRLHAIVYMRSNDAIWGLPYDIFLFTMLQELLASELGLELGSYTHVVASLHLYERHFELARRIVRNPSACDFEMAPMQAHRQIKTFLEFEGQLRSGRSIGVDQEPSLDPYWWNLLAVLDWFRLAKQADQYRDVANRIPIGSPYKPLLDNLVRTAQTEPRAYVAKSSG
jgi:thymidylate synthase